MGTWSQQGIIAALLVFVSSTASAAPIDHIGVAAAIKDEVHVTVGEKAEPLAAGGSIFQDEIVATGVNSMAQLLFLDQTSLSIGPQSEVKLDRFVYDPEQKRGDVVLEASRGAFRFITGAQDPNSYTLKTPVATIGVRGTIVDYGLENGRLVVRLVEGKAIITLENGQVLELNEPGDAVIILVDGTIIGPTPWDGEIGTAVSGTSFPLYGTHFAGTNDDRLEQISYDERSSLTDELGSRGVVSVVDDGGGGGEGGGEDHCYYHGESE